MNLQALKNTFPRENISWRAQSLTRNGDKALALAYIDARDVMERLDEVCGPEGWQDSYEVHGSKTLCRISIKIGDEWIGKTDGAGDTAVEKEKGSLSDAFKRAAVKWGIGRYLYDIPAPWVPCDTYDRGGKKAFSKFTEDPWDFVRGPASSQPSPKPEPEVTAKNPTARATYEALQMALREAAEGTLADFDRWRNLPSSQTAFKSLPRDWQQTLRKELDETRATLVAKDAQNTIGA